MPRPALMTERPGGRTKWLAVVLVTALCTAVAVMTFGSPDMKSPGVADAAVVGTTVGTGLLGIRLRDFVIGAGISAVIWTAIPLSIGYAFRSNVTTIEGYYHSILDALPMTLGIASLIVVAGVLGRSAATRARLREMVAPVWSRNHPPAVSIPEISQEPPPALN